MSEHWKVRKRPVRLERRFEFESYDDTRDFLDLAAELAEKEDYYPDMSFGRTHVSITLKSEEEESEVNENIKRYAAMLDDLAPAAPRTIDAS
ncbi:MAG: 4a-hydroxytetrahydrobiopterin dehydratase [Thiotrichaceae bacterium]|nr:4a-hydroxytetrahydrobiopterin dehydratase [Thiotrichaceae bacterium]